MDSMTIIFAAASVVAALSIALVLGGLLRLRQSDRRLNARLQSVLDDEAYDPLAAEGAAPSGRAMLRDRLDSAIGETSYARRTARKLEQANLPLTVAEWLMLRAAALVGLPLAAFAYARSLLALPPALLVGFAAPIIVLNSLRHRRSQLFADQLAETLSMLVSGLRGGFSLAQALQTVVRETQEPTRGELRRVAEEMQVGLSLGDALDNLAARVSVPDLELVVAAIKVNSRVGGNLTEILESISSTIRERAKLRREVRVITSMQRMSAYVIGLLPPGLAAIIYTINPEYIGRLFEPGWILCIPIAAFVFATAGFLTIRKLADIKV